MKALPPQRHRHDGFTLIELLTVMAVIALLIGLTLAGVSSMGETKSLTNAGNSIRDLVNIARTTARSHNSLTMLVTPAKTDHSDNNKVFAVFEKKTGETLWKAITRWERLPEGIELKGSGEFLGNTTAESIYQGRTEITPFARIEFLPNGRVRSPNLPSLEFTSNNKHDYYKIVINSTTGVPIIERP